MREFDETIYPDDPEPEFKPAPQEKNKGSGKIVALALFFSLIGGVIGSGITGFLQNEKGVTSDQSAKGTSSTEIFISNRDNIQLQEADAGKKMTPAQVYAQNVNSTVGITTAITTNYWGYQTTSAASGSGFIISANGYILTNYHVIQDSSSITVNLYDGTAYDAEVVGYDSGNDIAVIKVDGKNLTPVLIGDSEEMYVGDSVVAIGNPLGELTFSLTQGVISAKDRQVTMATGSTMELLQTDCSINSGNSGGALFNLYGEVVGITNAKYSNNGSATEASIENIGFAIPIEDIMPLVESIVENGYIAKPYIGVSVTDVSRETQSYGLPEGAAVQEVVKNSPAEDAGLQVNDIITEVNGSVIQGSADLVNIVSRAKVDDTLTLQVYRKGETITIVITVAEKIQAALPEEETIQTPRR